MIFHPAQSQIAKDNHRFRVLRCGRRFGKTTLAAIEMLGFASAYEEARVPYYAPTRDDARDIMWRMLQVIAENSIIDKNEARLELTIKNKFGGRSYISLYGWEAVQERKKGVGVKNRFIVLDEVAKYKKFKEGWQEVLRPTLTDLKGHALFLSTPQGFNHFYELGNLEQVDKDYKSFHFTTYDNPYIAVEEIEKARQELTEDAFAQEYLADYRKHTGLIYKEFDREVHVIKPRDFDREWRYFRAMDFGASHPTVCLWYVLDNYGTMYVYDEYYRPGEETSFHANVIKQKTGSTNILATPCDPSAEQQHLDYAAFGLYLTPAPKVTEGNKNWVLSGIDKVKRRLHFDANKRPQLYITNNCQNLIKEFESYHWLEKKSTGEEQDIPEKINDDGIDALRYGICYEESLLDSGFKIDLQENFINPNAFTGY